MYLYPVRAEHDFPPTTGSLDATCSVAGSGVASVLLFEALARLGGAFGAGRLRRRPRFARQGLATLGLAKLRKWLSSAGACIFMC